MRPNQPNDRSGTTCSDSILAERICTLERVSNERDRRYEDRFTAMDEKTSLALNASEKAVTKAEIAQEKRFDNTNEWRAAMNDRDRNQMPRSEIEQRFDAMKRQQNWSFMACIALLSVVGGLIVALLRR